MAAEKFSRANDQEAVAAPALHEERFNEFLELSGEWYWEQDEDFRFTLIMGPGFAATLGDPRCFIGKTLWDGNALPVGDDESWDKHKAILEARQPFTDFVTRLVDARDEVHYIRSSGQPVYVKSRFTGYRGIAKDITSQQRADQLHRLEHMVARCIAGADDVSVALNTVIRSICETQGWECGRYLRVDEQAGVLRFSESWSMPGEAVVRFLAAKREVALAPGVGLAGLAWQTGRPAWITDITRAPNALMSAVTLGTGMHCAFHFPVKSEGKTIGVLAFNGRRVYEPDGRLLQAAITIGSQIGQFIQRMQAENDLRQFRVALDSSADMILLIDRKTMRYVDVNQTACRLLGYSREELLKMGPQDLLPESQGELAQAHDELIANPSILSGMRSHLRCKDGSTIPFESTRHVLRFGESFIIAAVCRDIRERLAAEEAQRQQVALIAQSVEKDRLLRLFYDLPFVGLAITAPSSKRWLQVNDRMCEILGYPREDLLKLAWTDITHPDDLARNLALFQRLLAGDFDAFQFDKRFLRKDGGIVDATTNVRCVRRGDGSVETVIIMVQDISERKRSEEALRQSEARFRNLTELSSDLYWEQDDQFRFTSMTGIGSARVNMATFHSVIGRRQWEQNYNNMTAEDWAGHIATLEAREPFHDLELCWQDASGTSVWMSMSGEPVFDPSGAFKGYRGVGKDITGRKQAEERIQYLATHDGLTSLPNRAMFSRLVNFAIAHARRRSYCLAVLFLDLDRFKAVNDTFGHEGGDKLLQEMAARFTACLRDSDVVARLGGDEFVVLLQEIGDAMQAAAVARKILAAAARPMTVLGQECQITASIGICMYPADAQDESSLMKNADIAMYLAKEEGRNNVQFYSGNIKSQSLERIGLEAQLRRALERGELFLHYQPKLDLHTQAITGVEALLRWQNPEFGLVAPARFISIAEETGLILPIGRWVLKAACTQNVAWQRAGLPPVCMAVNLTARQFADEHLVHDVAGALEDTSMDPRLLEIEFAENVLMYHPQEAVKVLKAIKGLGVRIAIHNFGAGYSALAQIEHFPIDTLKVDRSFVRGLAEDAGSQVIMRAIFAMARALSLTVVAEGVETKEQQAFLSNHACNAVQGFHFSKPVAHEELASLLRQHRGLLPTSD